MNWFGFAPVREGMLVEIEQTAGGAGLEAELVTTPADDQPVGRRPAALETSHPRGDVARLLASLATLGAIPAALAPQVAEVLREVALRHPGALQVVDAVATGGTIGATVVLVVERGSLPEVTPDDVARRFGLTRRQGAVALLLARRHSNAEIARVLAVSPHTARHHTERVLERLGVSSRMQVAALVLGAE